MCKPRQTNRSQLPPRPFLQAQPSRSSLKPQATARDVSPVRNAPLAAPSRAESHSTPPRTPATAPAGNSRVPGERQAYPVTPVPHHQEGSLGGSSSTSARPTVLPFMYDWDEEATEGSLPVYLEEEDDDVDGEDGPSTPQMPFEAQRDGISYRVAGSGGERKVESNGGVQPKPPPSEIGKKISQNMIEIGRLLEAAKRSGEEMRDRGCCVTLSNDAVCYLQAGSWCPKWRRVSVRMCMCMEP